MASHDLDETRHRHFGAAIVGIAPEMQSQADMSEQPALLGGEDGGQPRGRFVDMDERARLFLHTAKRCRMTDDLCGTQRHFLRYSMRFHATTNEDSQSSLVVSSCLLEQRTIMPGEVLRS
ncbi:hypothetical protein [Mesorhizobium sp. M00.F.Ca.ET.220.01.1.1]|uniref:hypothetical protein n=1 Tax=Mesorhizobium sp. M00.F.Ca.ET.220.01.1.1 TaxID=2500531 RepID=UPI001FE1DCC8|nr:hypothetical protein [Mesorhizobium sp. M00.F.Ca.ET.220.01.1.1]